MKWYAAHAIMYFQLKKVPQDQFQVYENIFLVQAATPAEAHEKATTLARRDEGDSSGSLRVGDVPATLVFGGIRKLISVHHERPGTKSATAMRSRIPNSWFLTGNRWIA